MEHEKFTCPHCGNPDCNVEAIFCFNCGKYLHNRCSYAICPLADSDAGDLNPNMVFCPECGSPSTFSNAGYISPKEFN